MQSNIPRGGSFHIDIARDQIVEGSSLLPDIVRTSKIAVTQFVGKADYKTAWEFPGHLFKAVPCPVHTMTSGEAAAMTGRAPLPA